MCVAVFQLSLYNWKSCRVGGKLFFLWLVVTWQYGTVPIPPDGVPSGKLFWESSHLSTTRKAGGRNTVRRDWPEHAQKIELPFCCKSQGTVRRHGACDPCLVS